MIQTIFSQKSFPSYCVITSTNITIFTIVKFSSWQVSEQISEHYSHNSFQPAGLCLRAEVVFYLANISKAPKTRGEKKSVVLFKERLFCLIYIVEKMKTFWDTQGIEGETLSVWTNWVQPFPSAASHNLSYSWKSPQILQKSFVILIERNSFYFAIQTIGWKKHVLKWKKNHANLIRSSGKRKLPNSFIFVVYDGVQISSRERVFKRQDSYLSAFLQVDLQL